MSAAALLPEIELLLACAASQDTRAAELMSQPVDWRGFVRLADANGLLAAVSQFLARYSSNAVPPEWVAEIRTRADFKALRSLGMAGELTRVFRKFDAAGITAIAFKGPVLAHLAYGNLALRDSADLDIFVPRQQLQGAIALLAEDGYAKKSDGWNIGLEGACEIALQRHDRPCEIDLHWQFSPPYFLPLDADRFAARSTVLRAAGFSVRTLCPEDLLIYLCVHAARECWGLARFISDIAGLIARCSLDWDDLAREAEQAKCRRVVDIGLNLACEYLSAPVPPEIRSRIYRNRAVGAVTRQVLTNLNAGVTNYAGVPGGALSHLSMIETVSGKTRYLWRRALQPNHLDGEFLRLPDSLSKAYFLVRPFRVACVAMTRLRTRPAQPAA